MKQKIILSWSSGKDSSLALRELKQQGDYEIILLTTITDKFERVSMHGVRETLLDRQAESLGCSLEKVYIPPDCTNAEYSQKMEAVLTRYQKLGVTQVAFGDIFLADVRAYREKNLEKVGLEAIFPLWGREPRALANTFIDLGFQSIVTCVDTHSLDGKFAGRLFDRQFLADLPQITDPCGENGEFHTFTFDGPIFSKRIAFATGEKVLRDGRFFYCDLVI